MKLTQKKLKDSIDKSSDIDEDKKNEWIWLYDNSKYNILYTLNCININMRIAHKRH